MERYLLERADYDAGEEWVADDRFLCRHLCGEGDAGSQSGRMSLLDALHINADTLVVVWPSQVRLHELARYHEMDIHMETICVGNELRQRSSRSERESLTARLSSALANVINVYRQSLDKHGWKIPLTYAIEKEGLPLSVKARFVNGWGL